MTDETPDVVSRARAALDGIRPDCWCIADAAEIISDLLAEVERMRQQPVELSASMLADAVKAEAERDEARAAVDRVGKLAGDLEDGGCVSCGSITGGDALAESIRGALDGEA